MDFIKNAMSQGSDKDHSEEKPQQKADYVDKAFAASLKKSGYNIDRDTQEKITDGAREAFEKVTGKHVNEKISN